MPHRTHEARACLFRGFLSSLLPEWEPEGKQTRVRRGRERERSGGHPSLVLAWLSETGTQQPPPPFHRWAPGTSDSPPRVTEPGSLSCLCLEFNAEAGWGCGGPFQILPNSLGSSSSCRVYDIIPKTRSPRNVLPLGF